MFKKFFILTIMALIAISCSSADNPLTTPTENLDSQTPAVARVSEDSSSGRVFWGYFSWVIDTENDTFEAIPIRSTEMHLNVTKFIDAPPTKFAFTGFSIDHDASTISLDVGITHPFSGKPNLAGFDVRGILIGSGTKSGFVDSTLVLAGDNETHLANPDGWTRWWNPVEFTNSDKPLFSYQDGAFGISNDVGNYNCTLNAYKIFADDLGKTEHPDGLTLNARAVFSPGATNTRHYTIFFPKEDDHFVLRFNYAVDACWEPVPGYTPGDPVSIPDDYPASANQPEPFRMDIDVIYNSLYYVDDSSRGGTALLYVKVFDWQGYLDTADVADQVSDVIIESPDCLDTPFSFTSIINPGSGTQAFAVFEVIIDGSHLTTPTESDALLTVVSAGGDYQPALTGYSGPPLASYELFDFPDIGNIAPQNIFPTACATADTLTVVQGETVTFDASCSEDSDGIIINYDWDFDGDGTYGDPFDGGDMIHPEVIYPVLGDFDVDLRVTDDQGGTDLLDEPITILVIEPDNFPPEAVATSDLTEIYPDESVTFDGSASNDSDGIIVKWEWDFDGDGTYGDPFDSGTEQNPVVSYPEIGSFDADLMVTDDDGATDLLNDKITIYVVSPENVPPVALAEVITDNIWADAPVEFDASASYDTDGTVEEWLWDFNEDGIYGDTPDAGTPDHPISSFPEGTHYIDLKVIDNGGKSDFLDTLIEIFVESHVVITLPEDQDFKSADGYEYLALSCVTPEDIPIDYFDLYGPWDFTGNAWLPDPDYLNIFLPGDDEIEIFESDFPDTVQYFARYDIYGGGIAAWLTLAEEANLVDDLLYIHGHIEQMMDDPLGSTTWYDEDSNGPIAIQYPYDIFLDQNCHLEFVEASLPFIEIIYHEEGFGEGISVVPFDGTWSTRSLLTRTTWDIKIGGQLVAEVLIYKWTADDGTQVARLYTLNTPELDNFDNSTYAITGESRLVVLNDDF